MAQPGEILEYCISYLNSGGAATNFVLTDNAPATTTPAPARTARAWACSSRGPA